MRQSKAKIQKLESLFQLDGQSLAPARARALSPEQVSELQTIMDFIRSDHPLPDSLIEWLAQLALLYGVPYNHLVADERLMSNTAKGPSNLICFFYIDMKWIDSMIDGALSIGTHNSKDFRLQQAVHKAFRPHIESEMLDLHRKVKGKPLAASQGPEKMGTLAGFLLRSPLVLHWPGIEITGYNRVLKTNDYASELQEFEDSDFIMPVLRMERLAPDTMLMIFKGVPKSILVKEPSEGNYCGFTTTGEGQFELNYRELDGALRIGRPKEISGKKEYTLAKSDWRNQEKRVLNIRALKTHLARKYQRELQPKDMAVLFINSPRYFFYQNDKSDANQ